MSARLPTPAPPAGPQPLLGSRAQPAPVCWHPGVRALSWGSPLPPPLQPSKLGVSSTQRETCPQEGAERLRLAPVAPRPARKERGLRGSRRPEPAFCLRPDLFIQSGSWLPVPPLQRKATALCPPPHPTCTPHLLAGVPCLLDGICRGGPSSGRNPNPSGFRVWDS